MMSSSQPNMLFFLSYCWNLISWKPNVFITEWFSGEKVMTLLSRKPGIVWQFGQETLGILCFIYYLISSKSSISRFLFYTFSEIFRLVWS